VSCTRCIVYSKHVNIHVNIHNLFFSPLFDKTDLVMRLFSNKYEMEPAGHANTTSSTGPCLKDAAELSCETIGVGPGNMEHLALAILGGKWVQ
jgi:hypothetical protein